MYKYKNLLTFYTLTDRIINTDLKNKILYTQTISLSSTGSTQKRKIKTG
jgi:hypothetical protein